MAHMFYNEPYRTAPLTATRHDHKDTRRMEFRLNCAGREHVLSVSGAKPSYLPQEHTNEHFFKEHQWGFGTTRGGRTLRYEVRHPRWEVFPVREYYLDFDGSAVYGPEWAFLGKATPYSTVFAVGSAVEVYPKDRA
jgi:hypothetical protein